MENRIRFFGTQIDSVWATVKHALLILNEDFYEKYYVHF